MHIGTVAATGLGLTGTSLLVEGELSGVTIGILDFPAMRVRLRPLGDVKLKGGGDLGKAQDRLLVSTSIAWSPDSTMLLCELNETLYLIDLVGWTASDLGIRVREVAWSSDHSLIAGLGLGSLDVYREHDGHAVSRIGPEEIVIFDGSGIIRRRFALRGEYSLGDLNWLGGTRRLSYTHLRATSVGPVPVEEKHAAILELETGRRQSIHRIWRRQGP